MTQADEGSREAAEEGDTTRKVQVKLRVTPHLRARLEKSAAQRGVTLNQEMNYRLEHSFVFDEELEDLGRNYEKMGKDLARMQNEWGNVKQALLKTLPELGEELLAAWKEGSQGG